jgi:phosphohistidine phosphatase SixA
MTRTALLLFLTLWLPAPADAQHTVVLVRHAERADTVKGGTPTMAGDPDLAPAGRERAASLANMLKDAKITAIYATNFKRTQQTAAPLAKVLGLTVRTVPSNNVSDLLKAIQSDKGNALVVGHSNTVPEVIKGLGVTTPVTINDDEYDNLFVVTTGASPTLLRLHFR